MDGEEAHASGSRRGAYWRVSTESYPDDFEPEPKLKKKRRYSTGSLPKELPTVTFVGGIKRTQPYALSETPSSYFSHHHQQQQHQRREEMRAAEKRSNFIQIQPTPVCVPNWHDIGRRLSTTAKKPYSLPKSSLPSLSEKQDAMMNLMAGVKTKAVLEAPFFSRIEPLPIEAGNEMTWLATSPTLDNFVDWNGGEPRPPDHQHAAEKAVSDPKPCNGEKQPKHTPKLLI